MPGEYAKRANPWARDFQALLEKVDQALRTTQLELEVEHDETNRIEIMGTWESGNKDEYNRAWEEMKAVTTALKAARIWTDYDDNTTPKESREGQWKVIVKWHV